MKFKDNFFVNYLKEAPLSLAVERTLECEILSRQEFNRPVLDLGCGDGIFAYILFNEEIDAGIDPNEKELKSAKEYGMYKELIKCYGDNIPKKSNSFNTIFSNSVLEHIPEISLVLREVHRLLSPQGKLYITVPNNLFDNYSVMFQLLSALRLSYLAERYRLFFNKFWKHYHFYNIEGWSGIFQKNGFEILEVRTYADKKVCLLNDMLAPFAIISFIVKKIFGRWFLFKKIRSLYAPLLFKIFNTAIKTNSRKEKSGLLFFCLKKVP